MSDIEQRLRQAHPLSIQFAIGSRIFLDAAEEIATLRATLEAARMAERTWEKTMMEVIGEDGPASVADAIRKLQDQAAQAPAKVPEAGSAEMNEAACRFIEALPEGEFRRSTARCRDLKPAIHAAAKYLLTTPTPATTPETEWVKCADRLPTEADGEHVWVHDEDTGSTELISYAWVRGLWNGDKASHWKPTGLKRPAPPQEQ